MKILSEGAEAKIYGTRFLGIDAIVKDRIAKRYRIKEIDGQIRAQRTKREARILGLASASGINTPRVMAVSKTRIYMSSINGTGLASIMRGDHSVPGGRLAEAIYNAGIAAGKLHNIDIAHGDYTPANLMIGNDGTLWVIDFGLAEITKSVEEKALDLLLMKRSLDKMLYGRFMEGYKKSSKIHSEVEKRLAEIERRGRYQTRTLMPG